MKWRSLSRRDPDPSPQALTEKYRISPHIPDDLAEVGGATAGVCWLCFQALLSEDELVGVEHASATAAEVTGSVMRLKMELEEKKCSVSMLQTALVRRRRRTLFTSGFVAFWHKHAEKLWVCGFCLLGSGPAERADNKTCEGDREGAEPEPPAPEGTIRSYHSEAPRLHRPGVQTCSRCHVHILPSVTCGVSSSSVIKRL